MQLFKIILFFVALAAIVCGITYVVFGVIIPSFYEFIPTLRRY